MGLGLCVLGNAADDLGARATRADQNLEAFVRAVQAGAINSVPQPGVTAVLTLASDARKADNQTIVRFAHDWCIAYESFEARGARVLVNDDDNIRRAFPNDAPLLLIQGAIDEQGMGPLSRAGRNAADGETVRASDRVSLLHGDFDRSRAHDAEAFMRQALALDATLIDARVHLGRILFLLGRDAEAQPALSQALDAARSAGDASTAYLAALFLGQLNAEQGQTALAREMDELATTFQPSAPSAWLALGGLQLAAGETVDGWQTSTRPVGGRAASPQQAAVDPYSLYPSPYFSTLTSQLAALRAMVQQ